MKAVSPTSYGQSKKKEKEKKKKKKKCGQRDEQTNGRAKNYVPGSIDVGA